MIRRLPCVRLVAILSVAFLMGGVLCAQDPPAAERPRDVPPAEPSLHSGLDEILRHCVKDGLVDYERIRREYSVRLRDYLDQMAALHFEKLGRNARVAAYVNLYNATMIQAILDHTAADSDWTPASDAFRVFQEPRVRLGKSAITLNDLENDILRAQFKDARVHVALVCGARSCPPLLARAYEGSDLELVLTANLRTFLTDSTRNDVDHQRKIVRLSKIFEWYQADFGGESGVRKLLEGHFGSRVAGYRIEYMEYSWALNRLPPSRNK